MEQSESITELAGALAKAQSELKAAEMTATNPFLKNKYADLGEVIKASRGALTENGLSVVQPVSSSGEMVIVTTQLMHASGQWIRDTMAFPLTEQRGKSLAQEAGSIITYLRRYSLASMIGIYADDDTDGNEPKPAAKQAVKPAQPVEEQPTAEAAKMNIETAEAVLNSKGVRYGDLDSETLSNMTMGIGKALRKQDLTPEDRAEYQLKLDAIGVILKARAEITTGGVQLEA